MADQPEWRPLVQQMIVDIEKAFKDLQNTWKDIGFNNNMQLTHYDQAYEKILSLASMRDLFVKIVGEAQSIKQGLLNNIEDLSEQRTSLYAELQLDMEPQTPNDQIPLCRVYSMLQTDLQNLKRMKKDRMTIMKELIAKEHNLCRRFGCEPLSVIADNVLLSEQNLEDFKVDLQKQESKTVCLENDFADIPRSILKMVDDLELPLDVSYQELINFKEFVPIASTIPILRELRDELSVEVENVKCCIENMKENLLALWKYVNEPDDVCQAFLERHPNYNFNTREAFRVEIERCEEKKQANICQNITQVRKEILNLWDLCKYCKAERNDFVAFKCQILTEHLLTLHKLELKRLRKFYNDNQTIFNLLDQREDLIMKLKEQFKQERFRIKNIPECDHNRGRLLLGEELKSKEIQKKLHKIETKLKLLINEYETNHNQTFTIYGTSFENVLLETSENFNLEKEAMKKARKKV